MEKVRLGKTSQQVSQVCLGCMLMGSTVDEVTSFAMLDRFTGEGGNFLDTANCYAWWLGAGECVGDESETVVGRWLKHRSKRDKVFLATKAGARLKDPHRIRDAEGNVMWQMLPGEYEHLSPEVIRRGVEGSLRRLQTDYIDLYYAHIDDRCTALEDTLEALNQLVKEGKVRYIGCSNYRTWRLERARNISAAYGWASYVAVQQQYSYLRPKPGAQFGVMVNVDDELLDYLCANEDVTLLAYSPLLKGIYDDRQKREAYYNWALFNNDDARVRLTVLSEMAREVGVTNSQLVLAWLLHHRRPPVIPIWGFRCLEQFEQGLASLAIRLTDDHLAALNRASA
ncbi:MAG TPA: aldo/keto reductase [Anaerolineae bacterium]|nr:aldo/keto reductase [Anaerolineae bacterium]